MVTIKSRTTGRYAITRREWTTDQGTARTFKTQAEAEAFIYNDFAERNVRQFNSIVAGVGLVIDGRDVKISPLYADDDGPRGYGR